jgi:predicted Zn-dependent peptidase
MVVGVGGKIGDDLHERVRQLLGDLEEAETGRPEPVMVDPQDHPHVKVHTKASDQAHICLGVHSYPLEHPDRYVLQVLATVLGGGMSSRLFTEVRERRGLAYYVYGLNHSYTDTGSLYAQAGVDINRIDDAVTTVAAELRKIAEEPVPADEPRRRRALQKVASSSSRDLTSLIMFGLRREVLESRTSAPEEILEAIGKVTVEDVSRVAQD